MNIQKKLKQIFCNHINIVYVSNISADYINSKFDDMDFIGKEVWKCKRCGKVFCKNLKEDCSTAGWLDHKYYVK